ncbi:MAG: acyl carrier protein [Clostridiales bacterium]|nr:acyl carrier protein [Clostridiales bacterium]MCD7828096.1 acyl carrier protein [Clostridiales bacterium]
MVFEKIRTIISEQLDIEEEEITMDTTLDDLGVDSLDLIDIVMDLEDEFDLEVPDDALERFTSVGDVVAFVEGE